MKSHPLGFADGQHLFGFYYNTPDNTLPIFWCKSPNWSPAFVRYGKVYGIEGFVFQMSNIGNPFVECTSRDMSFKEVFQYWCNPF